MIMNESIWVDINYKGLESIILRQQKKKNS